MSLNPKDYIHHSVFVTEATFIDAQLDVGAVALRLIYRSPPFPIVTHVNAGCCTV